MNNPSSHILLSDLQALIKKCLQSEFYGGYWITAEVSEAKENSSGHFYMTLIEKNEKSQIPKARASAVIWSSRYAMIGSYFQKATGRNIESGMKLLLKVDVSYHELYSLSLVVTDIDPTYTLGDIERRRQMIIARLKDEGFWDLNREIELPYVMQRIAIVSSSTAAGYRDFINELSENEYGYRYITTLFDSVMQGESAEASIISSLDKIKRRNEEFDAVIIIRGGGAQSDLACFDSFELSCEIALMPIPVITGIGHDKDTSVADMVASVSLKTPTAVARFFIDYTQEFDNRLSETAEYIKEVVVEALECAKRESEDAVSTLRHITSSAVSETMLLLKEKEERLKYSTERYLERTEDFIVRKSLFIEETSRGTITDEIKNIEKIIGVLSLNSSAYIEKNKHIIATAKAIVEGFDPQRILSNGYAIARAGGKTIRSKKDVRTGELITINVADGIIKSEVKDII